MDDLTTDIMNAVNEDLAPNKLKAAMQAADTAPKKHIDGTEAFDTFLHQARKWQESTRKARANEIQRHKDDVRKLIEQRNLEIAEYTKTVERSQSHLDAATKAKAEAEKWFSDQLDEKKYSHLESVGKFEALEDMCAKVLGSTDA